MHAAGWGLPSVQPLEIPRKKTTLAPTNANLESVSLEAHNSPDEEMGTGSRLRNMDTCDQVF